MPSASAVLPEQGQLVSVRSRKWIVNDVAPSTLPTEGLHGVGNGQTLLTLSSIEDDGLGEELQVVWELEPGCRVIEKVALPDPTGFDPSDELNALLDAVRRGASTWATSASSVAAETTRRSKSTAGPNRFDLRRLSIRRFHCFAAKSGERPSRLGAPARG